MDKTTITIRPRGPFSWSALTDVMANFQPMTQHWQGSSEIVRMTFPLDQDFIPTGVALRFLNGQLHADVTGSRNLAAVERQVARIFSLDHDGTGYPAVGAPDPKVGALMAALPGLRPLNFTRRTRPLPGASSRSGSRCDRQHWSRRRSSPSTGIP